MSGTIGIVGLGRVGMSVARAYIKAGYRAYGHEQRSEAITEFEAFGGRHQVSPAEVARHAENVLLLVLNDAQVIDCVTGPNGILSGARPGTNIICMSTINCANVEAVAELCRKDGVGFVDCPFTGGPGRVATGDLTLIAAAPPRLLASVTPLLRIIGGVVHAGDKPGCGQAIKHCNQLLVGATHAATMEIITLARRLGLDPSLVTQVVGSGIAGSDYFRLLSDSVLKKTPSPGGLGQMSKDVSIVVQTARAMKMPAHVATAASQYFLVAEALGMEDREGADLIDVVERVSGKSEVEPAG